MAEGSSGIGFPAGHLNHLSSSQEAAFEQFKKLAADQGLYRPPADGQWPSHNDGTMLWVFYSERECFIIAHSPGGIFVRASSSRKQLSGSFRRPRNGARRTH